MIEFKVDGFIELEAALRRLPEEIAGKVLETALRKAGQPMAQGAIQAAPRSGSPSKAGHMADSIKMRVLREQSGANDLESNFWIGPDRDHFYGLFAEFGTKHQGARPFMRPAFDRHAKEVIDLLGKELWTGIERAAKKLAKKSSAGRTSSRSSSGSGDAPSSTPTSTTPFDRPRGPDGRFI